MAKDRKTGATQVSAAQAVAAHAEKEENRVQKRLDNQAMRDPISMGGGPDEPSIGSRVICLHCGDIIQSMYRHDFKWCSCHSVATDGGGDYLHMNYAENAVYRILEDGEDSDITLVGPRDTSQDKELCDNCGQIVLKSTTIRKEVMMEAFNTQTYETEYVLKWGIVCKIPCKKKEEGKEV